MNASDQYLKSLDTVCRCALCFNTGCRNHVHHFFLYAAAQWSSLYIQRLSYWLICMLLGCLGWLLSSLCVNYVKNPNQYSLCSHNIKQMFVPRVTKELGRLLNIS